MAQAEKVSCTSLQDKRFCATKKLVTKSIEFGHRNPVTESIYDQIWFGRKKTLSLSCPEFVTKSIVAKDFSR